MTKLFDEIPSFLREPYQLTATVLFTALFSLVFILVSVPFSHNAWFQLGASVAFAYTVTFFVIGMLVVIVSKCLMYKTRNLFSLNYLTYVLWNLAEVFVICLLYTGFTIHGNKTGIINVTDAAFVTIYMNALLYCFTSIVIPYIVAGMYFAIIDKNKTIRLMSLKEPVSDNANREKVSIFDNSGVMNLSVEISRLYFIESDDNYIKVWYTDDGGQIKNYYLRCRLKTVEESFKGSSLMRCHRKYIVNIDRVNALVKGPAGYNISLDNPAIPNIPVSKTYEPAILDRCASDRL